MIRMLFNQIVSSGQSDNLSAKLIRGAAGIGGLKLLSFPITLATSVVLARVFGVEDFGVYSYVFGLILLLALPAYAGLPPFLVREVSKYHHAESAGLLNGLILRAHQLALILGMFITLVVLGFLIWKARDDFNQETKLMLIAAVMIPFVSVVQVRSAILHGLTHVIQSKLADEVVKPISFLIIVLFLFFVGSLTPFSALLAQLTAIIITLIIVSILYKRQLKDVRVDPVFHDKRWKKSVLPFSAIAGVSCLNSELMIPLVGLLASNLEVAYFKVAISIATLVSVSLTIVEATIHPHITRLFASGEKTRLFRMVRLAGIAALLVSLPLVLVLIVFGQNVIEFVYGLEYSNAYRPLVIIIIGFMVVNLIGPSMLLLHATNYERDALIISIIGAGLTVLLCVTLIPEKGAVGAALAITISKVARALAFRIMAQFRINQYFQER